MQSAHAAVRWMLAVVAAFGLGAPLMAQSSPAAPVGDSLDYTVPFFPGAHYDAKVPDPASTLSFPVGQRPATHGQIESAIRAIAAASPRCKLFEYARSYEGRALVYLVVTSEENIRRLDELKADVARLADPRKVSTAEGDRLAETLPAVAWMAYTIHGDELSGSDASLALAYHLAACTDEPVRRMLDELVVIIDPLMNPDGRDRWLSMMQQNRAAAPSVDDQSLVHTGFWPSGRMNHYLFDLNRDWVFGTQPESRGRIAAAGGWNPQFFLESHEMGSQDTFLFSPPREPINPNTPLRSRRWWDVFARDHAAAFDQLGWRYYHGEWNEQWYPGYSGSWASLRGAIDELYEMASIATDAVRRREGTLQTYREAVHHQLVSSWANLGTLHKNRTAILRDFLADRRSAVATDGPYARRTFAVLAGSNASRLRTFCDLMKLQGFEVHAAGAEFHADGTDQLGRRFDERAFPPGTILLANRQPQAHLLAALLEFDPRLSDEFLQEERRELLRRGGSRLYDITAWNLTMLYGLEACELETELPAGAAAYQAPAALPPADALSNPGAQVGFVFAGTDDAALDASLRLMEQGVRVRAADRAFEFAGQRFPRGSLVVVRKDNLNFTGDLAEAVRRAALAASLPAVGVDTGLGIGDLPDLGGGHFDLLELPRIAVVGRDPISPYSFGEIWFLIDQRLGLRASFLSADHAGWADLRRYNVLVVPEGGDRLISDHRDGLQRWIESGGTLIAIGSSARRIAARDGGLGSIRTRPDLLDETDEVRRAILREWDGRNATVDAAQVWSHEAPNDVQYPWQADGADHPGGDELRRRDAWQAQFMPQGAILAARCDDEHWLTFGCPDVLPVLCGSGVPLATTANGLAPVRLGAYFPAPATDSAAASAKVSGWPISPPGFGLRLRMSGLLWPEAAERLAHAPYLTRESLGSGQIILFAEGPNFRAATFGSARLLMNALVFGPGLGASQPILP